MYYDEAGSLMMADFKTIEDRVSSCFYGGPISGRMASVVILDDVGTKYDDLMDNLNTARNPEDFFTRWLINSQSMLNKLRDK